MSDQETRRQTAERLAAERYPKKGPGPALEVREVLRDACISGYLAGRTVSAEQIEAAAVYGFESPDYNDAKFAELPEHAKQRKRDYMARLFRAIGFRIEGEE